MQTYDFASLNDKEFEALATDVLSESLGVRIERFKPGKDAGVDGRWFSHNGGETVIQCKHWLRTGFTGLLKQIKEHERRKVDALAPRRYILVTSVPLSRANKQQLSAVLSPHIGLPSDIWGPEDLNDALGRYPSIERRHYKLWLSGSNALSLLLNNAIHGRSRWELEEMKREASLYVATVDHTRALDHLTQHGVLIVTGAPGVGKTTLARQLVLEHVLQGFQLVSLEESISEAEAVYDEQAKQIFYFDDFLGRTFLESLSPKQDSHLTGFVGRVARDSLKRFVLTSRTNILNRGMELSDLLGAPHVLKRTYELNIGHWSPMDRAQVFYSHVWHSNLSVDYIDEIYHEKRYHNVIDHANFNPRLVKFVLESDKVATIPPDAYWKYIVATLNDPKDVWRHFFEVQLTQDCRDIVFLTVLNGRGIPEDELRDGFSALPSQQGLNAGLTYHRFGVAVRLATGSVLNRSIGSWPRSAQYSLFNPSIADYVLRYLSGSDLWPHYFIGLRSLPSLWQLNHLEKQPFFEHSAYVDVLRALATRERKRGEARDMYSLNLAGLLAEHGTLRTEFQDLIRAWVEEPDASVITDDSEEYLRLMSAWVKGATPQLTADGLRRMIDTLEDANADLPLEDDELLASILDAVRNACSPEVQTTLRNMILRQWDEYITEYIRENGILDEYYADNEAYLARGELEFQIKNKLHDSGIILATSELARLCDAVSVDDIISDNITRAARPGPGFSEGRLASGQTRGDAAAIDDLFDRSGQ